jgi:phosphate transport system substrate-binding protein
MRRLLLLAVLLAAGCGGHGKAELRGAGSTLVAPLVSTWASGEGRAVAYAPVGSAGGVYQLSSGTVDFAGSDAPLSAEQRRACRACVAIPWALSATVVGYDLPGISRPLRLDGAVLADVYRGAIARWDDPRIAALNPGLRLPDRRIDVLFRSDASGDTYVFTRFLSGASAAWRAAAGVPATALQWPLGTGARGNAAMAELIRQTPGSLGYVSLAQARQSRLAVARIGSAAGGFVAPNERTISSRAYPLSTFTFAIVSRRSARVADLKAFLRYALSRGSTGVVGFAPVPRVVVARDERLVAGL